MNLEQTIGKLLTDKRLSLGIAESCTGGLLSSKLTDIPGSSSYIKFNAVTYSNEFKAKILGVDENILKTKGAVSQETALAMAKGIRLLANTDIGVGITGIAGPSGGTPEKPVGLVFIGIAGKDFSEVHELKIPSDFSRKQIKEKACQQALLFLETFINNNFLKN